MRASTNRDERESYQVFKSNSSEQEKTKRHIDTCYSNRICCLSMKQENQHFSVFLLFRFIHLVYSEYRIQ